MLSSGAQSRGAAPSRERAGVRHGLGSSGGTASEKDPAKRPQSAAEVAARVVRDWPIGAVRSACASRLRPAYAIPAIALVLLGLAVWFYLRSKCRQAIPQSPILLPTLSSPALPTRLATRPFPRRPHAGLLSKPALPSEPRAISGSSCFLTASRYKSLTIRSLIRHCILSGRRSYRLHRFLISPERLPPFSDLHRLHAGRRFRTVPAEFSGTELAGRWPSVILPNQVGHPHGTRDPKTDRSDLREIYFPAHERGMVHYSYLSPDKKSVLLVEMIDTFRFPCRVVPFSGGSAGRLVGPDGTCSWRRGPPMGNGCI